MWWERVRFGGEGGSKETWTKSFEGKLKAGISISRLKLQVCGIMFPAFGIAICDDGFVVLWYILALRHFEVQK
jgi:hypothetical protein